jgi:hypothetical protein
MDGMPRGIVERLEVVVSIDPFLGLKALATYSGMSVRTLRSHLDAQPDARCLAIASTVACSFGDLNSTNGCDSSDREAVPASPPLSKTSRQLRGSPMLVDLTSLDSLTIQRRLKSV